MTKVELLVNLAKEINKNPSAFSEDFVESVADELEKEDIEVRVCKNCGKIITDGYIYDYDAFCSDLCIEKFTGVDFEDIEQLYDDESDFFYYTEWTEEIIL